MVLDFVADIIDDLEVRQGRIRIGAITFGDDAVVRLPLGKLYLKEDIKQAIKSFPYARGKTNIADAFKVLREEMIDDDNSLSPKLAIVISDGQSTVNEDQTLPEAIKAKIAGLQVIVATIENGPTLEIMGMASKPAGSNVIYVERFDELSGIINNMTTIICDSEYE